jgi:hypothetical protein
VNNILFSTEVCKKSVCIFTVGYSELYVLSGNILTGNIFQDIMKT